MQALILSRIDCRTNTPGIDPIASLTDREFEVLRLIGFGFGTRQIAESLNRSVKTIEAHRANIKEKLFLKTSVELIRFASVWIAENE